MNTTPSTASSLFEDLLPARHTFPVVGDGTYMESQAEIHREELQLAFRNKAVPLEALRYDVTPAGLHYTLIHYDIPEIDTSSWRLSVTGDLESPREWTLEELRALPARNLRVTLQCAGDGRALAHPRAISQPWLTGAVGTAEWLGTSLANLLHATNFRSSVRDIVFTGVDHGYEGGILQKYQRSLTVSHALHKDVLLAWGMNGADLPPQHGFPLRLVVPGWYGMASVKWLTAIEAKSEEFQGYQQATAYRYADTRDHPGEPVSVMRVRSLMIPPGVPDYLTRTRVVPQMPVTLTGRAWSGSGPISRVQFSDDGGSSWSDAIVEPSPHTHAWQQWTFAWNPRAAGMAELCCLAEDVAGNTQPLDQNWNARGMGNNTAHRVSVLVI